MVVRMMKWRPWPPLMLSSKKFEVKIIVHQLKGLSGLLMEDYERLVVEVEWKGSSKGSNALSLSSFRKNSIKRNLTKEESLREDGIVEWNEEFHSVCNFAAHNKEGSFHPWEVTFNAFNVLNQGQNDNKVPVIASTTLDLASFASATDQNGIEVNIPLQTSSLKNEIKSSLSLSVSLIEMRTSREPSEVMQTRAMSLPPPALIVEVLSTEKDVKKGSRRGNIFRGLSTRRAKKEHHEEEGSDGKSSVRSEDAHYIYPLDTDSLDDSDEGVSEEEKVSSCIRKSFSYGTLAYVNQAGGLFYSNASSMEDEDSIYYAYRKANSGNSYEDSTSSVPDQSSRHSPIRSILPWKKRRLSFRSSKEKGEPLLKKYYGDEGGDDIDHDRRQLSSSDESNFGLLKSEENRSSVSEFGDDNFAIGSWEEKELLSRDGHLKLRARVFFSSIDQRSGRAAGESACTALVAVIADWFQSNLDEMPIKSQLDSLIREGSMEWRNLCENKTYRERFPDKHFDLETVLQAKIRPLSVVPEKSFIGFFHPEGIEEGELDFLQGAMSFDNIWDEISRSQDPVIYIVSWNDHFFILKVEHDAYYIIDTLGERLFEGCNQAFILKFDRDTEIHRVPEETRKSDDGKPKTDKKEAITSEGESFVRNELVCKGKDSCKEYIKSFLAAIPIRELLVDLKKGLMASTTPLHHRLQIEFHYTTSVPSLPESCSEDEEKVIANAAEVLALAAAV